MDKSLWKLASIWDLEADDRPEASGWRVRYVRVLDRGAGPAPASVGSSEPAGVQSPLRPACTVRDFLSREVDLGMELVIN